MDVETIKKKTSHMFTTLVIITETLPSREMYRNHCCVYRIKTSVITTGCMRERGL